MGHGHGGAESTAGFGMDLGTAVGDPLTPGWASQWGKTAQGLCTLFIALSLSLHFSVCFLLSLFSLDEEQYDLLIPTSSKGHMLRNNASDD